MNKKIIIIGGGTRYPLRSHLGLDSGGAYGNTAKELYSLCKEIFGDKFDIATHLTRMAGGGKSLETNDDVENLINKLKEDGSTRMIFLPVSLCDWVGDIDDVPSSKLAKRLTTHETRHHNLTLRPAKKIINIIRQGEKGRKDIFVVGFKHTNGANEKEQYIAGLNLLKEASCNLVLANDETTRLNMVIVPEEAKYGVTTDRHDALRELVEIAEARTHINFTQSIIMGTEGVPWNSPEIPNSLRKVVEYCIERNAYKPFNGATAGHFAYKLNDVTFLTSKRKSDFNKLKEIGLIKCVTSGPDTVLAYGGKPSVGGQSQRIVFKDHPGYDCIVHFHSPIREGSLVPQVSQREMECGSHECGQNTSNGLKQFGPIKAVYLFNHGPNIVFPSSVDPNYIIDFIETNFDLDQKTGGYVV